MKDQRLKVFRAALDELVESLDAVVRVAGWGDDEQPPEPLRSAVSKLPERLSSADRLASSTFVGSPRDTDKVSAMCKALKHLDSAYVKYRKRVDTTREQGAHAAATLQSDIAEVTDLPWMRAGEL
jgi:hypothetical protein